MMLSIFSCACWPFVYLLWRNVCSGLLPIFQLGCLFFCWWVLWIACIFWRLSPCHVHHLQLFLPFCVLSFILFMVSFAVQNFVSLIRSHWFILILFLLLWETDLRRHLSGWCQRMCCLCSLPGVWWCLVLFNAGHSDLCELIPHYSMACVSVITITMLNFISCAFWPSVCLWRNVYSDSLLICLVWLPFF